MTLSAPCPTTAPGLEALEKHSLDGGDDGKGKRDVPTLSDVDVEHDGEDRLYSRFTGWMALDEKSVDGALKLQSFQPKKWEETDVDIKITCCGVCGSDLHVLRSGWVRSL